MNCCECTLSITMSKNNDEWKRKACSVLSLSTGGHFCCWFQLIHKTFGYYWISVVLLSSANELVHYIVLSSFIEKKLNAFGQRKQYKETNLSSHHLHLSFLSAASQARRRPVQPTKRLTFPSGATKTQRGGPHTQHPLPSVQLPSADRFTPRLSACHLQKVPLASNQRPCKKCRIKICCFPSFNLNPMILWDSHAFLRDLLFLLLLHISHLHRSLKNIMGVKFNRMLVCCYLSSTLKSSMKGFYFTRAADCHVLTSLLYTDAHLADL